MNHFETPIDFQIRKFNNDIVLNYAELSEIAQGGPVIGKLFINGSQVNAQYFGGPIVFGKEHIYAPIFIRKFIGVGFKLCRIDLKSLSVEVVGKSYDVIFIDEVRDNIVYFF